MGPESAAHAATAAMQMKGLALRTGALVFTVISKWVMGTSQSKRLEVRPN
jgi:hypothetical protein